MKEWKFKHTKNFIPDIYKAVYTRRMDYWWQFYKALGEFKNNYKRKVAASLQKSFYATMLVWREQITNTGELPHTSFIESK